MGKELTNEALGVIAERFRILSEPIRLRLLRGLREGERTVTELTRDLDISQPNASKHLRLLQESGLVARDQRGNSVYYSIADESIFALCEAVCDSLGERFRERAEILGVV